MEIGSRAPAPPRPAAVKTEWAERPDAPPPRGEPPVDKSVGETLNGLVGVDTRKNYFREDKKLDKEAFLKMFLEQIKYQDPTKPVDNEKVAQQMAMFSQLEQQILTNKNLEKMITGNNNSHLMALNLMGKEISVDHLTIQHEKNQPSAFNFKLPQEASMVKVKILNSSGEMVDELDLGARTEGPIEGRWLGSFADGRKAESGRYFYAVEASGLNGSPIQVESKLTGKVSGVSSSDGRTMLHVGDQKVDLMEVSLVKEGTPEVAKPLNAGLDANNAVGTKSESIVPEKETASKVKTAPEVSIAGDVADEIRGERPRVEDMGDLLNPIMPIFSR